MRITGPVLGLLVTATMLLPVAAQEPNRSEDAFAQTAPKVGDPIPDVTGFDEHGAPFPLRERLQGSYTVLVFGCLT